MAEDAPVTHEQLLAALVTINRIRNLGDAIYAVKENADYTNFTGNSWDHPDVKAYGDAVTTVQRAIGQYRAGDIINTEA